MTHPPGPYSRNRDYPQGLQLSAMTHLTTPVVGSMSATMAGPGRSASQVQQCVVGQVCSNPKRRARGWITSRQGCIISLGASFWAADWTQRDGRAGGLDRAASSLWVRAAGALHRVPRLLVLDPGERGDAGRVGLLAARGTLTGSALLKNGAPHPEPKR